ncbi:MAG: hypothetical protein GXP25_20935 [Planctomycetes bacterium]|nr:hypothetical protein [Planctomycetota bacterium]
MKAKVLPLLLVSLVAGCITYEEEMRLNGDGSGSVDIHYFLSKDMAKFLDGVAQQIAADPRLKGQGDVGPLFSEAGVRKVLEGKKGLTLKRVKEEDKGAERHIYLTLRFDSLPALNDAFVFRNSSISFHELPDGRRQYTRELGEFAGLAHGSRMYPAFPPLMQAAKNAKIKFVLHLPGAILESNATKTPNSTTAVWECGMLKLGNISTMTATIAPKTNVYIYMALVGFVILCILVYLRIRLAMRQSKGDSEPS